MGYRHRGWYGGHDYDEEDSGARDGEGEYVVNDLIDSEVTLTHWTGLDGATLEETSLYLGGAEVCASTPSGDLTPYSQEYEGYMGNWGNTLDRWFRRAAVAVWPRELAFANRAEASPAWALDELAEMASSGDVAGAWAAATTLAPFWDGVWHDKMPGAEGPTSGLFGKALRAAEAVADAAIAAMLLRPFRVGSLTTVYASSFAKMADGYGQQWTAELLRAWFGGEQPSWAYGEGREVRQWAADWLPGLCEALRPLGNVSTAAARQLLDLSWERIVQSIRSAFALSLPSHRDDELNDLGRPLAAVLTAAAVMRAAGTRDAVAAYIRQQDDMVTVLELSALRTSIATPGPGAAGDAGWDVLASDCAERLRTRLARPVRETGDWSIAFSAAGCACAVCGTLGRFLEADNRRTFEWPLAKDGRQHVHSRIDGAELPVTHVTRRQGRPYTLVLAKTDALFTREQEARAKDETDLAWLVSTWRNGTDDANGR